MNKLLPIAAAAIAVAGGAWWYTQQSAPAPGVTPVELGSGAANAQESAGEIDTSTITEMVQGADDAPITIVEYASYTCPHCATFHSGVYKQLKSDYIDTGKVKFIYREVYFDQYGLWASMVARCGGPERFFGISDLIYAGQSEWARAGDPGAIADELRKIGRIAGLGDEELQSCLTDATKAQTLVAWFEENAEADGIRSTPSFVIDGELYSNMSYSEFQSLLDGKLDG